MDSIGQILGEEVIRVMGNIPRTASDVAIWGAQRTIGVPGRRRTNTGREGAPGAYADADPVAIRLGLLRIGEIALAAVTGELYTPIGLRLKQESPLTNLVIVTLANGKSVGYIPDDGAYERHTFQVLGTRIKKGYAEQAIVRTLVEMIEESMTAA